eukprot:COSAG01_NODE_3318_length_6272_cov_2.193261_2_plen_53_part_00
MLLMAGLLLGGEAASQGSTAPAAGVLLAAGLLLGGGSRCWRDADSVQCLLLS